MWFYWYIVFVEVNYQGSIWHTVSSFVYISLEDENLVEEALDPEYVTFFLCELNNSFLLTYSVNIRFWGRISGLKLLNRGDTPFSKSGLFFSFFFFFFFTLKSVFRHCYIFPAKEQSFLRIPDPRVLFSRSETGKDSLALSDFALLG